MITFLFVMFIVIPISVVLSIAESAKTKEEKERRRAESIRRKNREDKYDNDYGVIDYFDHKK